MKILFVLIILWAGVCYADGPRYQHKNPITQLEFEEVYQSLSQKLSTVTITSNFITNSTSYIQNSVSLQSGSTAYPQFLYVGSSASIPTASITTNKVSSETWKGFGIMPIIQIQSYSTNTSSSNPTTNWIMTTLNGSFTPKISTSKIFIFANGNASQDAGDGGYLSIFRDGTNLGDSTLGLFGTISANNYGVSMVITDSPASASAITYSVRIKSRTGASTIRFPHDTGSGVPTAVMNIIEVAQ